MATFLLDDRAFNVYRFNCFGELKDVYNIILDSIAILHGEYNINRKYAAVLILKILLNNDFYKVLLDDNGIYPFDRNDYRVRKWKEIVLSKNECEECGSKENLEAHHIIKWADYPQGRIDIKNGKCLCLKCHIKEHIDDLSFYMMRGKLNAKTNT